MLLTNQLAGFPTSIPFRFAHLCHAFPVNKYLRNFGVHQPFFFKMLSYTVANIFMCDFELKWSMNAKIIPLFWNHYVDDTFTMFHNKDSANEFLHYLDSCHSNIKFTIEFEQNNAIPFLDILVTRNQNNTFITSIYRKKKLSEVSTRNGIPSLHESTK